MAGFGVLALLHSGLSLPSEEGDYGAVALAGKGVDGVTKAAAPVDAGRASCF
jgi:hypothetical protein